MNTLKQITITVVILLVGTFLVYNYVPLSVLDKLSISDKHFGATVTTIQGTDTLSDSRSTINTNFSNINTELGTVTGTTTNSTITTLSGLTTASNLATVGTLTSGTIGAGFTTIDETVGGTGLTSYATGDVIYASGANTLAKLTASSTGEVLTLQGGVPVWKDAVVNENNTYNWTALHTFSGNLLSTASSTFSATTSISASNVLSDAFNINGVNYAFPSTQGADGTSFVNNGSGALSNKYLGKFTYSTTTNITVSNTFATTTGFALPSGLFTASTTIHVRAAVECDDNTGGSTCDFYLRDSSGATFATCSFGAPTGVSDFKSNIDLYVRNNNATNSQESICYMDASYSGDTAASSGNEESTSAIETSGAITLHGVIEQSTSGDDISLFNMFIEVEN